MKILITGATGFVGRNFIPVLCCRFPNMKVLTLNRSLAKAVSFYSYENCLNLSTNEMDKIKEFNPDIVFHLATLSTSRDDKDIIHPMLSTNIEFGVELLNVLNECTNLKLFVNIGSFAEYRLGPQKIDDAYLYTATKSAFRIFLEYYSNLKGYKYVHLVPYTIYGGKDTAKKLIDYICDSLYTKEPIEMTAGEQILDFIHIKDIVSFFILIIENPCLFYQLPNAEEFHLGTGKGIQVRNLSEMIEGVFGGKCNIEWGGRPYRLNDVMYAVAPIAKNISILGWKAQIDLEKGLNLMKENANLLISNNNSSVNFNINI